MCTDEGMHSSGEIARSHYHKVNRSIDSQCVWKELRVSNQRLEEMVELAGKCRGRPLHLGPVLDEKVMTYLHALRDSGGGVNRRVVLGVHWD